MIYQLSYCENLKGDNPYHWGVQRSFQLPIQISLVFSGFKTNGPSFIHYKVDHSFFSEDRPLIVQFAANNGKDLADASEIVSP